jgi:hypothetical protein
MCVAVNSEGPNDPWLPIAESIELFAHDGTELTPGTDGTPEPLPEATPLEW